MKKILLSTQVPNDKTAWSKAREDVKEILIRSGYHVVFFPKLNSIGEFVRFWRLLSSIVEKDSHLILEYPCAPRKRMWMIAAFSYLKRIKLYGIIHDITDLRFPDAEQKSDMHFLKRFDGLISHNSSMTAWLREKGYKRPVVDLGMFDYCLEDAKDYNRPDISGDLQVLYAGNLAYEKATYIYDRKFNRLDGIQLCVYGQHFEKERINGSHVNYMGTFNPGKPDLPDNYHFGLIWEGTSIDSCEGQYGNYIRFNNPHKFSLYLSLGLPVIVWKEAAIASVVTDNNIGFTIESFNELEQMAGKISDEKYMEYVNNIKKISGKVRNGFFLETAIKQLINS